jgi:hypothetical protein
MGRGSVVLDGVGERLCGVPAAATRAFEPHSRAVDTCRSELDDCFELHAACSVSAPFVPQTVELI